MNYEFICHKCKWETYEEFVIVEKLGRASCMAYIQDGDFILYKLNVSEPRIGLGLSCQEYRENLALSLGFKECYLWVKPNTWMLDWYKRRGYKPYKKDNGVMTDAELCENGNIWLKKEL